MFSSLMKLEKTLPRWSRSRWRPPNPKKPSLRREAKESPIVATPAAGWAVARTEIAQQPSGATLAVRVRPLGSLVERVRRTPRPARSALSTRFAAYWTPERSPLIRLPPNRLPSYCSSVSVPTRKLSGE